MTEDMNNNNTSDARPTLKFNSTLINERENTQ